MSKLEFVKYHGLGNDFVVVEQSVTSETARAICAPRRGVGADGVISLEIHESRGGADEAPSATMTIWNADGSRPEMCGNGLRCAARYLDEAGHWDGRDAVVIETDAGRRRGRVIDRSDGAWRIEVSMGNSSIEGQMSVDAPDGSGDEVVLDAVDMGNPHAVAFDVDWDVESIAALGETLNNDHPDFPAGVNLEAVRSTATDRLVVVVYERGVGLTDACGSGACAVAVADWHRSGGGDTGDEGPTDVELPGGVLTVERREDEVWLTGPAVRVFEGRMNDAGLEAALAYEM